MNLPSESPTNADTGPEGTSLGMPTPPEPGGLQPAQNTACPGRAHSDAKPGKTGCPGKTHSDAEPAKPGCPGSGHSGGADGSNSTPHTLDRRAMLVGTAAVGVGYLGYRGLSNFPRRESAVFVAAHQRYDAALERTITDGLMAAGLTPQDVSGKRVLLKPNLVEPNRSIPHMTTHPAMVVAAAEVFRRWGGEVLVGEAPGHVRDTEMALFESGLEEALIQSRLDFADLNYEPVQKVENLGRTSPLRNWYLPQSVATADLIVSMPKLKTHHWMGMTASMKNLYGTLPGIKYGWPKNVLHHAGIPETVFDINATLPRTIAIVDAIVCMEGDGPLMGSPKPLGLVVIGENPTAVDATCARLMGLDPTRISYLQLAAQRLGPVAETLIHQRGEPWIDHRQAFEVLDYPHLQNLRAAESGIRAT